MKKRRSIEKSVITRLFLIFFCLIMVVSGLWRFSDIAFVWVLVLSMLALLVFDEIQISKNIRNYFFILLFMFVGLFVYQGSMEEVDKILMFGAGGLLMLLSYNVSLVKSKEWVKKLVNLLMGVGVVYAFVFMLKEMGLESVKGFYGEMVKWVVGGRDHHHIGDYWVIPVLVMVWEYLTIRKLTRKTLFLSLLGIFILWISRSRSAYISLFASGLYLLSNVGNIKIPRKTKMVFVWLVLVLMVISGFSKSIISSRPYWVQGAYGLRNYPLGVGFGNFGMLSEDVSNHLFGLSAYSSIAHNILLEFMVGYGVLGLIFVFWYVVVVKNVFSSGGLVLEKSIFLALSINFLTDYTYFVPSMIWVWFVMVGVMEGYSEK